MMHLHFIVILFKKWNPRDDDIDELHNYSYKKKKVIVIYYVFAIVTFVKVMLIKMSIMRMAVQ